MTLISLMVYNQPALVVEILNFSLFLYLTTKNERQKNSQRIIRV